MVTVDAKGKAKKKYPYKEVMTPYERLKSLPGAQSCLAPGVTPASLDAIALEMTPHHDGA